MENKNLLTLPKNAPFSQEQKIWLEGYIKGVSYVTNLVNESSDKENLQQTSAILFASQTGNAESIALDLADKLKAFSVIDMAEISAQDFRSLKQAVIITSTYGEGEHPDNGQILWDSMQQESGITLGSMEYAVLGLGDTAYEEFCKAAEDWDAFLRGLGARPLLNLVKLDVDYEAHTNEWMERLVAVCNDKTATIPSKKTPPPKLQKKKSVYSKSNPFMSTLLQRRLLSGQSSSKQVFHFSFAANDTDMRYSVGDTLGVIPSNSDTLVNGILGSGGWTGDEEIAGATLKDELKYKWEIRLPNTTFITAVLERTRDKKLHNIFKDKEAREDFLYGREVLDFLREYQPSFTPQEFVKLLKPLQHRLYSISSSPKYHPGEVHLTIVNVEYTFSGRPCQGVASCFLSQRANVGEKVPIFIHPNRSFSIPEDGTAPIVMVGPGTGIAPFRAFMQERLAREATGENWLFFGDRTRKDDFLYEQELCAWQKQGKLRLSLAWSRETSARQASKKNYVQDRMLEEGKDIFILLERNGHFFVCGDAKRMARDVEATLLEIIATHGAMTVEKAVAYLNALKKEKRYVRDVY